MTPTITGPDGAVYNLHFERAPVSIWGIYVWPGTQVAVLSVAILTAFVVSFVLARYVSSPVVRLQKASRALAAGAQRKRCERDGRDCPRGFRSCAA